ncbi:MAG: hypothetical protein QM767_23080 [Anaeromyxobacter sp.]
MDPTHKKHRLASFIGALIALVVFAFVGLRAALYFGEYAGKLLAEGILGAPAEGAAVGVALLWFGKFVGIAAVGSLFAVVGGTIGAGVSAIFGRLVGRKPTAGSA